MKNILYFFITALCLSSISNAQNEDYSPYLTKSFTIDYRQYTIDVLGLNEKEIEKFDPIFDDFMKEKAESTKKRMKLLANLREELAEDDTQKDEDEEFADFIEEYWEEAIGEMDDKKDFFDKLEDEIPVAKATNFFFWDEAINRRTTNNLLGDILPMIHIDLYTLRNWNRNANSVADKMTRTANYTYKAPDVSTEDYRKYIDGKMQMEFRTATLKMLNLTSDEINDFDPIFSSYMAKKENILEERLSLLEDFEAEMKEDDSVKNEENDKADFIENYLELDIADMKLKKNFFDKLEDRIPVDKAFQFFLWEDAVENRMIMNTLSTIFYQFRPLDYPPAVRSRKPSVSTNTKTNASMLSAATKQMIQNYHNWVMNNQGKVDLSHEYTSQGLQTLVKIVESIKMDKNVSIMDFEKKKALILQNASKMQQNWKSDKHADQTKAAFTAIAEIMMQINGSSNLKGVASKLQVNTLLTKQAQTIYEFFDTASTELKSM